MFLIKLKTLIPYLIKFKIKKIKYIKGLYECMKLKIIIRKIKKINLVLNKNIE